MKKSAPQTCDFLVIGSGLAGLLTALKLAKSGRVYLVTKGSLEDGATSFAFGPEIGFVPADNMLLTIGYNVTGFRDPDFASARSTERGLFAAIRVKFDEKSLDFLGLGAR